MKVAPQQIQTDDELASNAAHGYEPAFTELVRRHRSMIFRIARRYFRRHDEVDEIVHVCTIEAWLAMKSYRGGEPHSFAAWMTRIAVNSCYDELRRRKRRKENVISQLSEGESISLIEYAPADDAGCQLENELISRDLTDKLLGLLEPVDRHVFLMLKSENYSVAEVAKNVGWTETKVKMRVHRSRSILQRRSQRFLYRD
jgi:RNA polymerase sigma factor (sigma-70 family)